MIEDTQLYNPLKRPVILALYKAAKELVPKEDIQYWEHYERELEREEDE